MQMNGGCRPFSQSAQHAIEPCALWRHCPPTLSSLPKHLLKHTPHYASRPHQAPVRHGGGILCKVHLPPVQRVHLLQQLLHLATRQRKVAVLQRLAQLRQGGTGGRCLCAYSGAVVWGAEGQRARGPAAHCSSCTRACRGHSGRSAQYRCCCRYRPASCLDSLKKDKK
jgi:hypothetical protein